MTPLLRDALDANPTPLSGTSTWRLVTLSDLRAREPRASLLRVVHAVDVDPGGTVAVTAPVTYPVEPLASRLRESDSRSLVLPNALLYFPCARLPALRDGTVEVPAYIVPLENRHSPIQFPFTSPFRGVLDLYALEELPMSSPDRQSDEILAYRVDRRISGATLAPPDATES